MEKLSFIFLHGFLGRPQDWDSVIQNLRKEFPQHNYLAVDYFNYPPLSPKVDFKNWSENIFNYANAEFGNSRIILVGYSLGGRLALQALNYFSEKVFYTFLVSTNPGFQSSEAEERKKRLEQDQKWAERFLHDDWSQLIADWNAQPVFEGASKEPERSSSDFRRDLLAKALTKWSLANQDDLRMTLTLNQRKISWVIGDLDKKYVQMTKEIFKTCPDMNYSICPSSSHRVLFDNPIELARAITRVVRKDFKG